MATVRQEIPIDAPADAVWDALRDWAAPHERLVPGFLTATELDGDDRLVTFFDGTVARERLITLDAEDRRLVWSATGGALSHHNASARVTEDGAAGAVLTWTADFLPDDFAPRMRELIAAGGRAMQQALAAGS
jgi:carbon monoxide dehydrogenase subunit G